MNFMQTVLLCAGRGIRLGKLTENMPKSMIGINGKPFLEHLLLQLKKHNLVDIIIVIGYKKEVIIDFLKKNKNFRMNIELVEQKELLGTGHSLYSAKNLIKDDYFLALCGDIIFDFDIIDEFVKSNTPKVLVVELDYKSSSGLVYYKDNKLIKIDENSKEEGFNINGSVYVFPKKIFWAIENIGKSVKGEYWITDAINFLADRGVEFEILKIRKWIDIGTPENLKKGEILLKR